MTKKKVAKAESKTDNTPMSVQKPITLPKEILDLLTDKPEETEKQGPRPHLSFSQLAMFLRCSMQYKFRYVLGLKDRPKVSLSIGKGGHAALEWNTKRKIATGVDQPVEAVVQKASDFMDHYLRDLPASEYEKDVEPGETKDKFLAATQVFRVRDAPKITPIASELDFMLDMNEFLPEPVENPIRIVKGAIDLLSTDRDLHVAPPEITPIRIGDFKYVTRKRSQNEVNLSPQLTTYAGVVKKVTGKWPSRVGYTQLHPGTTRDAPDAIELLREPQYMTPESLAARMRRLAYQFFKMEEAIRADIFVPTDDPITCSWCGFRDRCQMTLVSDFEAATIRSQTSPPK